MSQRGKKLVDGRGASRVVSAIQSGTLQLRPAKRNDCQLLFEWVNDPAVRETSFSSAPIPWEQHEAWFASKQNDSACRILIAEDEEGKPVGQFRVDFRSTEEGEIDVSLSRNFRGTGYGSLLIDLGVRSVFAETTMDRLNAFVKAENNASRKAFEHAGFKILGDEKANEHKAIHYVRTRS